MRACVLEFRGLQRHATEGGRGFVAQSYWLDLFTGTTWEEFLAAGGEVSGFRERRWKTVQQMKPGDYLLCYRTGSSSTSEGPDYPGSGSTTCATTTRAPRWLRASQPRSSANGSATPPSR